MPLNMPHGPSHPGTDHTWFIHWTAAVGLRTTHRGARLRRGRRVTDHHPGAHAEPDVPVVVVVRTDESLGRLAIAAQGASSRSKSLSLCVTVPNYAPGPCNYHMITRIAGTNTDPSSPAGYSATIMSWVHTRLTDP